MFVQGQSCSCQHQEIKFALHSFSLYYIIDAILSLSLSLFYGLFHQEGAMFFYLVKEHKF